jgi:hypothetical protein
LAVAALQVKGQSIQAMELIVLSARQSRQLVAERAGTMGPSTVKTAALVARLVLTATDIQRQETAYLVKETLAEIATQALMARRAEAAAQALLVALEVRAVVLLREQAVLDQMPIQLGQQQPRLVSVAITQAAVAVETRAALDAQGQAEVLAEEEMAEVKSLAEKAQSITRELMERQTLVAVQVVDTQTAVLAS